MKKSVKAKSARKPFQGAVGVITKLNIQKALMPPVDETHVDMLHGIAVRDPFRPIENLQSPDVQNWVDRQNTQFEKFIAPAKSIADKTVAFLEAAEPQGMQESMPDRHGAIYTVWRKNKDDLRWSLFVKDVPDYDAPARLLIDPVQVDPSGNTNIASAAFTRDGSMLAYELSVSGSDKTTLKFMDVASGQNIDLEYQNFTFGIEWDRDGKGFHYVRKDEDLTNFKIMHHVMGTRPEDDVVIYSPEVKESFSTIFRIRKDSQDIQSDDEWITITPNEPDTNIVLSRKAGSGEAFREIFPRGKGLLSPFHQIGGMVYAETTVDAPNGRIVAFDINNSAPEKWCTIVPENPLDPLTGAWVWQNRLFASTKHDTGEVLKVYDLDGSYLHDAPLPLLSTFQMGNYRIQDPECFLSINNFQEAGAIYRYNAIDNSITLVKESNTPINLKDCIVERKSAISKDGTPVPMTIIRHPDTTLDGTAVTELYGYGGFNVPLDPVFSPRIADLVRSGGIFVQANLRGGGEFGEAWYAGGRGTKKQNVFDDMAACAEYLIDNGYTSNKRLYSRGGSNGGLLTLAVGLQRPDLFGAIVSEVPVTDMMRFHIGSEYGFAWKGDYGDPDKAEDFQILMEYSPYHTVPDGFKHPPLLIKTDLTDDRVQPWHAAKMAAMMQAKESDDSLTVMSANRHGGHGGGMTTKARREDAGMVRAFIHQTLGPIDQNEYKASMVAKAAGPVTPKP